jgi:hypothetical protein
MCFYYLLLGHLLGDFLLQTDRIAESKIRYWQWNVLHALIVTLCIFLFSVPFGVPVMLLVLLNGGMHYCIDYFKPRVAARFPLPGILYFLADQALHILLLYIVSLTALETLKTGYFNSLDARLLVVVVFLSSFCAVMNQYILSLFFPGAYRNFFLEDEKSTGNITRILLAFGVFLSVRISPLFLISLLPAAILVLYRYKTKWHRWMTPCHFVTRLAVDVLAAMVVTVVLFTF